MVKLSSSCNNKLHRLEVGSLRLYFSYETIVAFYDKFGNRVVHENDWGPTTGKHLNEIDGGDKQSRVPADEFERRLKETMTHYGL